MLLHSQRHIHTLPDIVFPSRKSNHVYSAHAIRNIWIKWQLPGSIKIRFADGIRGPNVIIVHPALHGVNLKKAAQRWNLCSFAHLDDQR